MDQHKRNATRRDVAEAAGVSETVVSYVVNGNRYVASDKRERVLKAIEELHYSPNSIARALKGKSTRHILLIADSVSNEYYGSLMQEINAVSYTAGFLVSLMGAQNTEEFVSRILSHQVDAVIISSSSMEDRYIQSLINSAIPVVLLMNKDYNALHGHPARIYTGIESGVMKAIRLLYEKGCRSLAYVDRVSANTHFSTRQDLRFRGFCNQLEVYGLPLDENSFISGCSSHEILYDTICRRVTEGPAVDGFICRNDRIACTVIAALEHCGKRIPEDVSVVGFDNSTLSRIIYPQLTTLAHDLPGIARAAIEMIEVMNRGEMPQDRYFSTTLIQRNTTPS